MPRTLGLTPTICFDEFLKVDMRGGTIVSAENFPEARKPAFRLVIDFGSTIGKKKSSAQITKHYRTDDLARRQVAAVIKFAPRQIRPFPRKSIHWAHESPHS